MFHVGLIIQQNQQKATTSSVVGPIVFNKSTDVHSIGQHKLNKLC